VVPHSIIPAPLNTVNIDGCDWRGLLVMINYEETATGVNFRLCP